MNVRVVCGLRALLTGDATLPPRSARTPRPVRQAQDSEPVEERGRRGSRRGIFALIAVFGCTTLPAERTEGFFRPPGSFAIEISLDNTPFLRLPVYRNAITSLTVVGDTIVGGTSASEEGSPFLFAASLRERRLVQVLDVETIVPGQSAVVSGFGRAADGALIVGTLPRDSKAAGHLLRVELGAGGLRARDLGAPVPGEGVLALATDARRRRVYGLAHPSGKFFVHELDAGKTTLFEETQPDKRARDAYHEYALRPEQYLSRQLAIDRAGRVYGSQPMGLLFRFDPETMRIDTLDARIPAIWDRAQIARVDAWALAPDGSLYGGNAADGQLFLLDPASGAVQNLGKPIGMPRMKGLGFAADGKLWGIAGGAPGFAHVFSYDPHTRSFDDHGNPNFELVGEGLVPGITWRGYQMSALAVSEDGRTVVLGDEEALSQLMVFPITPR